MRSLSAFLFVLGLVAGPSTRAEAQDRRSAYLLVHEQVSLLLNPMGAEHRLDLGMRRDLGDPDDLLLSGAHIESGLTTAVSPVYAIGGGYVQLAPFSFLVVRAEMVGATVWPIGMDGAGHYRLDSYDADVRMLPANEAASANGWLATVSMTLQGALDLEGGVRLLLMSDLALTRAVMSDGPFYYSMKHDVVLAREDFVVLSSSFVGVEFRAAPDLVVRLGGYDDLRFVPGSGYVGHQLGPIAMLEWQHTAPGIASLALFLRGGAYTHHITRAEEATILGGVAVDYDLGDL